MGPKVHQEPHLIRVVKLVIHKSRNDACLSDRLIA